MQNTPKNSYEKKKDNLGSLHPNQGDLLKKNIKMMELVQENPEDFIIREENHKKHFNKINEKFVVKNQKQLEHMQMKKNQGMTTGMGCTNERSINTRMSLPMNMGMGLKRQGMPTYPSEWKWENEQRYPMMGMNQEMCMENPEMGMESNNSYPWTSRPMEHGYENPRHGWSHNKEHHCSHFPAEYGYENPRHGWSHSKEHHCSHFPAEYGYENPRHGWSHNKEHHCSHFPAEYSWPRYNEEDYYPELCCTCPLRQMDFGMGKRSFSKKQRKCSKRMRNRHCSVREPRIYESSHFSSTVDPRVCVTPYSSTVDSRVFVTPYSSTVDPRLWSSHGLLVEPTNYLPTSLPNVHPSCLPTTLTGVHPSYLPTTGLTGVDPITGIRLSHPMSLSHLTSPLSLNYTNFNPTQWTGVHPSLNRVHPSVTQMGSVSTTQWTGVHPTQWTGVDPRLCYTGVFPTNQNQWTGVHPTQRTGVYPSQWAGVDPRICYTGVCPTSPTQWTGVHPSYHTSRVHPSEVYTRFNPKHCQTGEIESLHEHTLRINPYTVSPQEYLSYMSNPVELNKLSKGKYCPMRSVGMGFGKCPMTGNKYNKYMRKNYQGLGLEFKEPCDYKGLERMCKRFMKILNRVCPEAFSDMSRNVHTMWEKIRHFCPEKMIFRFESEPCHYLDLERVCKKLLTSLKELCPEAHVHMSRSVHTMWEKIRHFCPEKKLKKQCGHVRTTDDDFKNLEKVGKKLMKKLNKLCPEVSQFMSFSIHSMWEKIRNCCPTQKEFTFGEELECSKFEKLDKLCTNLKRKLSKLCPEAVNFMNKSIHSMWEKVKLCCPKEMSLLRVPHEFRSETLVHKYPVLGKTAPEFTATCFLNNEFKKIKLDDFIGKYVVLFFYPMDFSIVRPTEILSFSEHKKEFDKLNTVVLGCSIDSHYVHKQWCETPKQKGGLGKLDIALVSDISKEISKKYGVLIEEGCNKGVSLRGTFIIDPTGVLRNFSINDISVSRSVKEILRLVKGIKCVDEKVLEKKDFLVRPIHNTQETKEYFEKIND